MVSSYSSALVDSPYDPEKFASEMQVIEKQILFYFININRYMMKGCCFNLCFRSWRKRTNFWMTNWKCSRRNILRLVWGWNIPTEFAFAWNILAVLSDPCMNHYHPINWIWRTWPGKNQFSPSSGDYFYLSTQTFLLFLLEYSKYCVNTRFSLLLILNH